MAEKVGVEAASSQRKGQDLPRGCARVEGKAGRGTEADVRPSNVDSWSLGGFGSAASVALNLCVNVCPELWSRREPRAGRGAPGETEEWWRSRPETGV